MPHVRRLLPALAIAGGLMAIYCLVPLTAQADLVTPASCTVGDLSQPFLQWGDARTYELLPGGDFEGSLDGWTLQGGASQTSDNEPFALPGSTALVLPAGAVATAPAACVNVPQPDVRLFVRTDSPGAKLTVKALYDNGGTPIAIPAGGKVRPGSDWQPSQPLQVHPVVQPAMNGDGTAYLTLQFKASRGTVYIDDAFLDPWGRW